MAINTKKHMQYSSSLPCAVKDTEDEQGLILATEDQLLSDGRWKDIKLEVVF